MGTTVSLRTLVPQLYALADRGIGDWDKFLTIIEETFDDILGCEIERAYLDCATIGDGKLDTIIESVTLGRMISLPTFTLVGDSGGGVSVTTLASLLGMTVHYQPGVSTVADVEAAIVATGTVAQVKKPGTATTVLGALTAGTGTLAGPSPVGYDLAPISIDRFADIRDPSKMPAGLIPYLAQQLGWAMDPDTLVALQRKIVANVVALYQEKGTPAGILDALRLVVGIDATIYEPWADGWVLPLGLLGTETTHLTPDELAPAYATGELLSVAVSELTDHDTLECAAWPVSFEIQKISQGGGDTARGYLYAVERDRLSNGLPLIIDQRDGNIISFEFKVDSGFISRGGAWKTIDVSNSLYTDPEQVAAAIAARITAETLYTATTVGALVVVVADQNGTAANRAFTGGAVEVLDADGMYGGGTAGAFVPVGGSVVAVSFIGAVSSLDVARRLRYALLENVPTITAARDYETVLIRHLIKGTGGNGELTGALATKLSASGMSGGLGVSRRVLSFRIDALDHMDDDQLRVAHALCLTFKRHETHYTLVNPDADPAPTFFVGLQGPPSQLNVAHLRNYTTCLVDASRAQVGSYASDPSARYFGKSKVIEIPASGDAARSPRLVLGARYFVQADVDVYLRQGGGEVEATTSDMLLGADRRVMITPTLGTNAHISVRRVVAGPGPDYLRLTRADL